MIITEPGTIAGPRDSENQCSISRHPPRTPSPSPTHHTCGAYSLNAAFSPSSVDGVEIEEEVKSGALISSSFFDDVTRGQSEASVTFPPFHASARDGKVPSGFSGQIQDPACDWLICPAEISCNYQLKLYFN